MANTNVRFFFTNDINKYTSLATKDPFALYFIEDEATGYKALYKGENLMAVGSDATTLASGLMSATDKQKLDDFIASGGGISNLQPVDGTIVISDGEDGKKNIGVSISAEAGNILVKKSDGLYVDASGSIDVPEYAIEKQAVADEGFNATYKLKKTVGSESSYVGDAINVAFDAVLSSAEFKIVAEDDVPYEGAKIGDPYIELGFNDDARTHLYVPMKGLVDQYSAGDGLQLVDGTFSINLGTDANGLHFVDGSLNIALASADSAGAMSAEMFTAVDGLLQLDIATKSDLQEVIAETIGIPNAEQFTIDENGILNITSLDADKVMYNGQKLSNVLDEMNNTYVWEELTETVDTTADSAVASISAASEGATVKIASGAVAEAVTLDKSVTVEGETAGVAQNFSQEV